MADRTITVSTVGQPDKTITINRDRFAGVRTMTRQDADGSSSTITINRSVAGTKYGDKPGQPRPLLGKVVGGAAAAYSLRDLNDKQGTTKVLEVRRDADNAEKTFKAKDVHTIEDWVNGKLETTLPCDIPDNPQDITSFTVSGDLSGTYGKQSATRYQVGSDNSGSRYDYSSVVNRWILYNQDDGSSVEYWRADQQTDYPWEVTSWTNTLDEGITAPNNFRNFVGGNPDNSPVAAYSLRKVRNDYSGDAVQIRRASDNVEVNVAFDSNGEVSTSSAISNVVESPDQGDTTSTTLGAFLTEVVDILDEPNFATDTGTLLGFETTLTFNNDSVSDGSVSKDDCLEVELTSTGNTYIRDYGANLYSGINNVKIRFEADFYAPSTNTSAVNIRLQNTFEEINGGGSQVFFPTTKGAWTSVSVEGYPNQNQLQILILDRTVGDVYYFANMKISIIGHDGTVVTWYDQSGNGNHATQLATGSQPKIAENGSLLAELKFDGIDDFMQSDVSTSGNDTTILVAKNNSTTGASVLLSMEAQRLCMSLAQISKRFTALQLI
jgi:hypothetical protein